MTSSDKIAIVALVFSICSYIPSFIAIFRTTQRLRVSIEFFNTYTSNVTVELIFTLQISNPVNMPISVSKIELSVADKIFQTDNRLNSDFYIPPNGVLKETIVVYVPDEVAATSEPMRFILHTSSRRIKSKKFIISDLQ